jgi:uncharacterized membrane protein
MTPANSALRVGAGALVAQLLLQFAWHAWLAPGSRSALALAVVPLLPALIICLRNLRRGVLVGGIVSLFYFCHGISELWSNASLRRVALIEIVLSLIVIGALGWDARDYRRPAK